MMTTFHFEKESGNNEETTNLLMSIALVLY